MIQDGVRSEFQRLMLDCGDRCPCNGCLTRRERKRVYVNEIPAEVARQAVLDHHYSRLYPSGSHHHYGVYECDDLTSCRFLGAIIVGALSTNVSHSRLSVPKAATAELRRIALAGHRRPVSQMLRRMLQLLRSCEPSLELLVSYADPAQDHLGLVYQASNWTYLGLGSGGGGQAVVVNGVRVHKRTLHHQYGTSSVSWIQENIDPNAVSIPRVRKHLYAFPLSRRVRRTLRTLAQPYPKAAEDSR